MKSVSFKRDKAMIYKSKIVNLLSFLIAFTVILIGSGNFEKAFAQDPFRKRQAAKPAPKPNPNPSTAGTTTSSKPKEKPPVAPKPTPAVPTVVKAPSIEERIAYYKMLRERAAMNGEPLPKVTTVLLLEEMAVTGIFRTSKGYSAMVEAKPIKLSYAIYPGEKFFDGQLVAIEENRLVFRKVTKMSNNKYLVGEENLALRQYTVQEELQGTAPAEAPKGEQAANSQPVSQPEEKKTVAPIMIVSPLDEMAKAEKEAANKDKNSKDKVPAAKNGKEAQPVKKDSKKPIKVAKKGK